MSATTFTIEDCVRAVEAFAKEVTRVTGFDIEQGIEVNRPCFIDFGLTDDIREEFRHALGLMAKGKLNECLGALQESNQHLRNKRGAYLRGTVIPTLIEFPCDLSINYVRDEKIDLVRELVRKFEERYTEGIVDLDIASTDYWKIVDLCEVLKKEKRQEVVAEQELARARSEQSRSIHQTRCREAAEQLGGRFSHLMVA